MAITEIDSRMRYALIESCINTLPGVVSAWVEDDEHDELHASVVVEDQSRITPKSIQLKCLEDLGLHQTPRKVELAVITTLAA